MTVQDLVGWIRRQEVNILGRTEGEKRHVANKIGDGSPLAISMSMSRWIGQFPPNDEVRSVDVGGT